VEVCEGGECTRRPPPGCADDDPCTRDGCASPGTCVHEPACTPVPVRGRAACRLGTVGLPEGFCEDGDPTCDRDATTDGGCRFDLVLCVDVGSPKTGCSSGARLTSVVASRARDPSLAGLAALLQSRLLDAGPTCVGPVPVRVGLRGHLRRKATRVRVPLVLRTAEGRQLRGRVTLACRPAPRDRAHRPPAPLVP
jgi:hypothetical protein